MARHHEAFHLTNDFVPVSISPRKQVAYFSHRLALCGATAGHVFERPAGSLRRGPGNKRGGTRLLIPIVPAAPAAGAAFQGKEMNMLKNSMRRRVLAAFGGVLMLAGVGGVATAFAGPDFQATLSGSNVPGGGDRDGWGRLRAEFDTGTNRLCADLEVRSIADVTSAQIYRGREGEQGEPVSRLERPDDDDSYDCKQVGADLAREIQSNPSAFYVMVATSEHPNGAIRGQLGPAG
jgi:hypothetical protein